MTQDEMQTLNTEFEACQKSFTALSDEVRKKTLMLMVLGDREGVRVAGLAEQTHLFR